MMGWMTLEDFRDSIQLALGEKVESGNGRLDRWVNRSYLHVSMRKRLTNTIECQSDTTIAGQSYLLFPSDLLGVISIADLTNKRKLIYTDLEQMQKTLRGSSDYGEPLYWSRRGNVLYFKPTPSGVFVIQLFFLAPPAPLTNPGQVTVFSAVYDEPIELRAIRNALLAKGLKDDSVYYERLAEMSMRDIPSEAEIDEESLSAPFTIVTLQEQLQEFD